MWEEHCAWTFGFHGLWAMTETDDYPPIPTLPLPFGRRTPEQAAVLNKNFISMLSFQLVVDHMIKYEESPEVEVATSGYWNDI